MKTDLDLKREFWEKQGFTTEMIAAVVRTYGNKPASYLEARYIVCYRFGELWAEIKRRFKRG